MRDRTTRNLWVVPTTGGFAVKREGRAAALHRTRTQRQAIAIARLAARFEGCELIVQNVRGRIRARDSHGRDPFPPRG